MKNRFTAKDARKMRYEKEYTIIMDEIKSKSLDGDEVYFYGDDIDLFTSNIEDILVEDGFKIERNTNSIDNRYIKISWKK